MRVSFKLGKGLLVKLCFRPRLVLLIFFYLRLKTKRFAFFTLFLYLLFLNSYFQENRVTIAIMLCMGDKLHEDDVLMILEELEVQNSRLNLLLIKTTFPQNSLSTSSL